MSDTPIDTPAEPAISEPDAPAEPQASSAPPWGEDFDPERAWKTITNLREREKELSKSQLTSDQRAKLDEYERLAEASKSELERAQEAAQKATETTTALRDRLVTAELRAALTGVVPDPATVIEDLNLSRFVGEDGEVNADAVAALRGKYAAFAPVEKPGMKSNPSQGRSASPSPGITEQIAQAQEAGDFKTAIRLKAAQQLSASEG